MCRGAAVNSCRKIKAAGRPSRRSAIPFGEDYGTPRAMVREDFERVLTAFVDATRPRGPGRLRLLRDAWRAWLSALVFLLAAVKSARGRIWRRDREPHALPVAGIPRDARGLAGGQAARRAPLLRRLGRGGTTIEDTIVFAKELKEAGCDFICCSSGGVVSMVPPLIRAGYQVKFAERIRREIGIPSRAVGMIFTGAQAEAIVAEGQADMVAVGRGYIDDPRWAWHAGDELGVLAPFASQAHTARNPNWIKNKREASKLLDK